MTKTLMAAALAAMFAVPLAASATSDRIVVAQGGGGGGADGPDMANRQPGTMSSQPGTMESDKMNAGRSERAPHSAAGAAGTSSNFDRLDRNGDGYISRDEAKDAAELQTRFSELDRNNDDKLSREEYDALNHGSRGELGASGATGTGRPSGSGGDASTSGANTK